RVLHRCRRAPRDADAPAAGPGPRRLRGAKGPDRRRRGRHRRHARPRQGLLRGQGGGGPLRGALREAPLDGRLRVRLASHRPLDRLPLERPGAGRRRARRDGLEARRKGGYSRSSPGHSRREEPSMKRTKIALAALLLTITAVAALVAATAGSAKRSDVFKVAWIYVGPHNDGGWSQAHDAGRLYVQKALGSKVQTTYKENVPEGPQVSQVIDSLVRDGNKIIFGTSFGYQDAMVAAAKKYPDVYFEQATGTKQSKNLAEYYGAGEDAIYLSGMAAGAATKKGVIGYVAPFAIPEVIRHTNAFTLGAQATHPGVKVKVIWTNSWFAPPKEKQAAESLSSAGADVLGQNVDSPATGQFAQSKGIPWVGYDS